MPYLPTNPGMSELPWLGGYSTEDPDPVAKPSTPAAPAESKPNPFGKPRATKAYEDLQNVQKQRPEKPKPSLWRTLAGIGTGFGIGYANAGGRIRPVDPTPAMRGIMYGDYDERTAQWEDQVKHARENLDAARAADQDELEYLEAPVKQENLSAQTATMRANLSAKSEPKPEEVKNVEVKEGKDGFYVVKTYERGRTETSKLNIPFSEKEKVATGQPFVGMVNGEEVFVERDPNTGAFKVVDGITPPPKNKDTPSRSPDSQAADARAVTADKVAAERKKAAALATAEEEWRKSLVGLTGQPRNPTAADYQVLRNRKQQIQNDYESELRAAGVKADHFEFPNADEEFQALQYLNTH